NVQQPRQEHSHLTKDTQPEASQNFSEISKTEMVKRMKKIGVKMKKWKVKDAELLEPKRVFIPVNEIDWPPLDALDGIEEAYALGTLLSLQIAESFKDPSPIQKLETVNNQPMKLKKTRRRDKLILKRSLLENLDNLKIFLNKNAPTDVIDRKNEELEKRYRKTRGPKQQSSKLVEMLKPTDCELTD
ncbi:unnamed protein product, partial [Caenorhabditis brenneri]